jgi:hypothetical protein
VTAEIQDAVIPSRFSEENTFSVLPLALECRGMQEIRPASRRIYQISRRRFFIEVRFSGSYQLPQKPGFYLLQTISFSLPNFRRNEKSFKIIIWLYFVLFESELFFCFSGALSRSGLNKKKNLRTFGRLHYVKWSCLSNVAHFFQFFEI